MRGLLIALEGIDGSGKAEQTKRLAAFLRSRGHRVVVFRYPDLRSKYGKILNAFLSGKKKLTPRAQISIFLADIAKDQEKIKRLLREGSTVLLDRYIHSTIAYQSAHGMSLAKAISIAESYGFIAPSALLLLDLPPTEAVERIRRRHCGRAEDIHDFDTRLLSKVRANYLKLRKRNWMAEKWFVLDASQPISKVAEKAKSLIEGLL